MELDLRMVLKTFKYAGLSMKEFAIREDLNASTLYSISSRKQNYTEEYFNYICYLLERDYSKEWRKIKEIIKANRMIAGSNR